MRYGPVFKQQFLRLLVSSVNQHAKITRKWVKSTLKNFHFRHIKILHFSSYFLSIICKSDA